MIMENKINIAELLKDCPQGMELDCLLCNNPIELEGVVGNEASYPIRAVGKDGFHHVFTAYGEPYNHDDAKCVIFPKGKTTWEGFVPPYEFEDGDILISSLNNPFIFKQTNGLGNAQCYCAINCFEGFTLNSDNWTFIKGCRLATEEEKEKLFNVIKANGYKWNEETKTLEKLPKFKGGDRIKYINGKNKDGVEQGVILSLTNDTYDVAVTNDMGIFIPISEQDDWELVPTKFDITTLVPFESKVLVRDNEKEKWKPAIWGYYDTDNIKYYPYETICGNCFEFCIPYEGNEHLLGTKEDCDEFYKTW